MAQQQIDRIKRVQPTAIVNIPDSLRNATGTGELWIAPDGLPARQIINLEMPQVSREFHARLQMRTTFADFSGVPTTPSLHLQTPTHLRQVRRIAQASQVSNLSKGSEPFERWSAALLADLDVRTPLAASLFLLIALAYTLFYRHNHRRAYALMASLSSPLLISTPPLQSLATDLNAKYKLGLPTLSELLGFPKAANAASAKVAELMAPLQQTPGSTNALISKCGQGSGSLDTDGDALTDLDEGCLGTNPYSTDTDFDVLPDNFEVTNFTVGRASQWSLNPIKTDSNDDGLNDFIELPADRCATHHQQRHHHRQGRRGAQSTQPAPAASTGTTTACPTCGTTTTMATA